MEATERLNLTSSSMTNFKLYDIPHPHPHDVLCGRGPGILRHPGNKRWRELISENMADYVAMRRKHRPTIIHSIVQAVRSLSPPGRFLTRNRRTGTWYDIGDEQASLKTAQAMRDAKKGNKPKRKSKFKGMQGRNQKSSIGSGSTSSEQPSTDEGPAVSSAISVESQPRNICNTIDNTFDKQLEGFTFTTPPKDARSSCGSIGTLPDEDFETLLDETFYDAPVSVVQFDVSELPFPRLDKKGSNKSSTTSVSDIPQFILFELSKDRV